MASGKPYNITIPMLENGMEGKKLITMTPCTMLPTKMLFQNHSLLM